MAEDAPNQPPDPEPADTEFEPEMTEPESGVYTCPHCSATVAIDPNQRGPFVICPECGVEFAISTAPEEDDPEARARAEDELASRERELDAMRIRQLSRRRRAEIRAQGYLMVGLCGCVGGLLLIVFDAVKHVHAKNAPRLPVYLILRMIVGGVGTIWGAIYFFRRWRSIGAELRKSALVEPTTPPDFSSLSDGTQQVKHLEDVK
jgi:DNA-directed RNA polymerase subunit RPC12/RpoP